MPDARALFVRTLLALLLPAAAAGASPLPPATAPASAPAGDVGGVGDVGARLAKLLVELNAPSFRVREDATAALEQLPPEAVPLIEKLIADGMLAPEIQSRLERRMPVLRRGAVATAYQAKLDRDARFTYDAALEAYAHGGHADPRWDDAVRAALPVAIRPAAARNWTARDSAIGRAALRKALDLGCDDPLLQYLELRLAAEAREEPGAEPDPRLRPVVDAVVAGHYPEWRKVVALTYRARVTTAADKGKLSDGARTDRRAELDAATALYPKAVAAPGFPDALRLELAETLARAYGELLDDPQAGPARVAPALRSATGARSPLPLLFGARATLWRVENDRALRDAPARQALLDDAAALLQQAWDLDPTDPMAASEMVRLADLRALPIDEMEQWFARATEANPGSYDARWAKLRYLEHHADPDAVLRFGRECRRTDDWQGRLPFVLVDAHLHLGDFRVHQHFNAYLAEDEPWRDVRGVYVEYLRRYPHSVRDRCYFANLAARSGHWADAQAQFDLLGDDVVLERFNGASDLAYLKRKTAAALAAEQK